MDSNSRVWSEADVVQWNENHPVGSVFICAAYPDVEVISAAPAFLVLESSAAVECMIPGQWIGGGIKLDDLTFIRKPAKSPLMDALRAIAMPSTATHFAAVLLSEITHAGDRQEVDRLESRGFGLAMGLQIAEAISYDQCAALRQVFTDAALS